MPHHIVGLGCKARNGKDTVATIWKSLEANVHIIHFADSLYEEVRNSQRVNPLIMRLLRNDTYWYFINTENGSGPYTTLQFTEFEVPKLHKIFTDRGIEQYWGMEEKDPQMLQFWGTEFRRVKTSENYWVDRADDKIRQLMNSCKTDEQDNWYLIPDARFKNEFNFLKKWKGTFVKVERFEPDGTQFIDPHRDPKHPSETDLDDVTPDYYIKANSGDFTKLTQETRKLIDKIRLEKN